MKNILIGIIVVLLVQLIGVFLYVAFFQTNTLSVVSQAAKPESITIDSARVTNKNGAYIVARSGSRGYPGEIVASSPMLLPGTYSPLTLRYLPEDKRVARDGNLFIPTRGTTLYVFLATTIDMCPDNKIEYIPLRGGLLHQSLVTRITLL